LIASVADAVAGILFTCIQSTFFFDSAEHAVARDRTPEIGKHGIPGRLG
jgi:hypothetical protein